MLIILVCSIDFKLLPVFKERWKNIFKSETKYKKNVSSSHHTEKQRMTGQTSTRNIILQFVHLPKMQTVAQAAVSMTDEKF